MVHIQAGVFLAIFCMAELSIFVDESGHLICIVRYPLTILFHLSFIIKVTASKRICKQWMFISITYGYPGHCIHTEPIIRWEEVFETMSLEDRRKLFDAISLFTRKSHIRGKTFYEKKHFSDKLPPPLSEPSTANQSPSCLTFPFLPSSIGKSTLFPSLFQPQV